MHTLLRVVRSLRLVGLVLSALACGGESSFAQVAPEFARTSAIDAWVQTQREHSWQRLLQNLSPAGTAPGTVVASPSKESPNYWFHWVRDAGLVLDQVVARRTRVSGAEAQSLDSLLWNFTALSRRQQRVGNRSGGGDGRGLGEPKFEVTGEPFNGDWGRPQNDSPAARALTLIRWADFLLGQPDREGIHARIRKELYDSKLPSDSVIKNDLEYVAAHAQEPCIDLWEETWGHHFYTRALSESALMEGAKLARRLGDPFAADWYEKKAEFLRRALAEHWDATRKLLVITRDKPSSSAPEHPRLRPLDIAPQEWKPSGIDSAVILAILHRRTAQNPQSGRTEIAWSVLDPRVQSTFQIIETTFKNLYPINASSDVAPGIGRYPEDKYDGVETGTQGHAWVLATAGFAEFLYRSIIAELEPGRLKPTSASRQKLLGLFQKAESYVARLQKHAQASGNWSEQIHRTTGEQRGARDLTWSHAAFLSMADARDAARKRLN